MLRPRRIHILPAALLLTGLAGAAGCARSAQSDWAQTAPVLEPTSVVLRPAEIAPVEWAEATPATDRLDPLALP